MLKLWLSIAGLVIALGVAWREWDYHQTHSRTGPSGELVALALALACACLALCLREWSDWKGGEKARREQRESTDAFNRMSSLNRLDQTAKCVLANEISIKTFGKQLKRHVKKFGKEGLEWGYGSGDFENRYGVWFPRGGEDPSATKVWWEVYPDAE